METIPDNLVKFFEDNPKPALAFSGGVDSTYLMYVCRRLDVDMIPVFYTGGFQTVAQQVNVENLCQRFNFNPEFIEDDVFECKEIAANGPDRCYLCKKRMATLAWKRVKKFGCKYMMDGTNASDDPATRPGMRVLDELGIRSPLRECGLKKEDIRRLSKEAGLPTWDLPSDSCLATRIPTGTPVTRENTQRVNYVEKEIRVMGFKDIRVRDIDGNARLETLPSQKDLLEEMKPDIEAVLLKHYKSVTYGERKSQ
ncbi:MAG: ATP-dependent sacrificial sulfur transferase LarE [Candidatus Methanomethylophilaceae archaeon]|nr:ATP-dependent sacrificial sulfur transferase LarE [Candidatus Methanomethylophilaceae archaeon]